MRKFRRAKVLQKKVFIENILFFNIRFGILLFLYNLLLIYRMSQAHSRKKTTAVATRNHLEEQPESEKTISNRTIIATVSFLSKTYGRLPCFCDHDRLRMIKHCQASILSNSSNALWHRKTKSKEKIS